MHQIRGDLETLPDDAWLGGFELLFMSVLRASREALPLMRPSGVGVIVNISAADGLEPTLMFPVSGSMRAAVSALTKLLARRSDRRAYASTRYSRGSSSILPVSFAGDQDAKSPPKGLYTHFSIDCDSGLCTGQGDCAHGIEWLPNVMLAPWFA